MIVTEEISLSETLWRTLDGKRHFIIPDAEPRRPGSLALRSLAGDSLDVDPQWAQRFEVTEDAARAWAQEEFGFVLSQLRQRIDAKLARERASLDEARHAPVAPGGALSPDAVPAAFALLRKLPHAILDSLSGDPARVTRANDELAAVEQRLGTAGVDVAPKLREFPSRLAALRQDFEAARKPGDDRQR
jgi:hypothetical protein